MSTNKQTQQQQSPQSQSDAGKKKHSVDVTADIKGLDRIHVLFLIYSGAHNMIVSWHRADNLLFFLFVFAGILSVEVMLYTVYRNWKNGRLIGPMRRVSLFAGLVAMFYATAGILTHTAGGDGAYALFVNLHHTWILPTSAPVMFLFSFWIQSVDPVINAWREAEMVHKMTTAEGVMARAENRKMKMLEKRNIRRLEYRIKNMKISAIWREASTARVKHIIAQSIRVELPSSLRKLGMKVANYDNKTNWIGRPKPYRLQLPKTTENGQNAGRSSAQPKRSEPKSQK